MDNSSTHPVKELIVAIEGKRQRYQAMVAERAHKLQQMDNEQEEYEQDRFMLRALNSELRKRVEQK